MPGRCEPIRRGGECGPRSDNAVIRPNAREPAARAVRKSTYSENPVVKNLKNYFPPNVLNRKWGQAAWGIGLVSVAAALVVSVGCERQQTNTEKTKRSTPQFNAGRSASQTDLDRAAQRFAAGDYAGAIALLQPYLIQHADDAEALRLLAEAYAAQGEFE